MSTKKAGIITLYGSQNFGAFLQGYAMQTVLEKYGYHAEFIKYLGIDLHELLFMIKTKNISLALFRLKQYRKYMQCRKLLNVQSKKYHNEYYDAIIVGSDTLWDVQNPTIQPTDFYLGKNLNAEKIIAYAPSANGTGIKDFLAIYKDVAPFDAFDAIGVRDGNTRDLVDELSNQLVRVVLDPTLLLDKSDYPVAIPQRKDKYVLVYGYSFSNEEKNAIITEARRIHASIVSIGLLNPWCDENVTATVQEFLGYIKNAECVFTGTFHGTIFSMIMEKRFVTYARKNYKVQYLLQQLGMEERNGSIDIKNSGKLSEKEVDYAALHVRLQRFRKESFEFLLQTLNCNNKDKPTEYMVNIKN